MSDDTKAIELQLNGYTTFVLRKKENTYSIEILSSNIPLGIGMSFEERSIIAIIDQIELTLRGLEEDIYLDEIEKLDVVKSSDGSFVLKMEKNDGTHSTFLLSNEEDLKKFAEGLKEIVDWNSQKSNLIPPHIVKYIKTNPIDQIAKEIAEFIKSKREVNENLVLVDTDNVYKYFQEFWEKKGVDWFLLNCNSELNKPLAQIEEAAANLLEFEVLLAQQKMIEPWVQELAKLAFDKKQQKITHSFMEDYLTTKNIQMAEKFKNRLYRRANNKLSLLLDSR